MHGATPAEGERSSAAHGGDDLHVPPFEEAMGNRWVGGTEIE